MTTTGAILTCGHLLTSFGSVRGEAKPERSYPRLKRNGGRKRRETEVGGKGRDLEEDAANLLQRMNEPPPPPPSSTFTLEPPFSYV